MKTRKIRVSDEGQTVDTFIEDIKKAMYIVAVDRRKVTVEYEWNGQQIIGAFNRDDVLVIEPIVKTSLIRIGG